MPTQKYLLIHRSNATAGSGRKEPPSPAQMQEMYAAFNAWKEKFKANIADMGGKVIGGYMVVTAESYEQAFKIASEGPGMLMPGSSIEIREIATP
jgi:L-amino acid N-acyltransferase YncA